MNRFSLLLLAASAACSSPGGASSAASDSISSVCESSCGRSARCHPDASTPPVSDCVSSCVAGSGKPDIYKPGVLSSISSCLASLGCDTSDDICLTNVITAQNASWRQDPSYQACLTKHDECQTAASSFSDDKCPGVFIVIDSVKAALNACIARPCTEISACLTGVLG